MENVLLATGMPNIETVFEHPRFLSDYHVLEVVQKRADVLSTILKYKEHLDIVIITDLLPGKGLMLRLLMEIKKKNPDLRVVYLTADVSPNDDKRLNNLGTLVFMDIFDIVTSKTITPKLIFQTLKNPATEDNVEWITRFMNKQEHHTSKDVIEVTVEEEEDGTKEEVKGLPNVHTFSSIKPGTGKSFVSANIAATIAKYGAKREDGQPPKVAVIDGDLQNLSLGTLLQIESQEYNLKTVMDKIRTVIDEDGVVVDDPSRIREVNMFIKKAFIPYSHVKNLEALVGSQLDMRQIEDITAYEFMYLVQSIYEDYDVVIMDSNSSLSHVSTLPLLTMATSSYYILNLDFNNIRNNSRYQKTLASVGILDRVKYILNENITNESLKRSGSEEKLIYTEEHVEGSGFELAGTIPMVSKPVFLNHIYEGKPIALDDETCTLEARLSLAEIANDIWKIDKLDYLRTQFKKEKERELERLKPKKSLFRKG